MKKYIIDTIFQSLFLGLNVIGYFLPLLVNNHIYTTYYSMLEQPYGLTILGTFLFITIEYILYGYFIPDKNIYAIFVSVPVNQIRLTGLYNERLILNVDRISSIILLSNSILLSVWKISTVFQEIRAFWNARFSRVEFLLDPQRLSIISRLNKSICIHK